MLLLFTGCNNKHDEMDQALLFRQSLENASICSFYSQITADFGDATYQFKLFSTVDEKGEMKFTVCEPETISGIGGTFSADGGKLTFEDSVLAFPSVIEGELSPISTPWILYNCLIKGYISSCGTADKGIQMVIDDSYNGENLQCIVWFGADNRPLYSEIIWKDRRVLSVNVDEFVIQ